MVAIKRAGKRHTHCRVGKIAQDSTVQGPHGIRMLRTGVKMSHRAPVRHVIHFEAD